MTPLSPTARALSVFGVFLGALFAALILLDDWLEKTGRQTISARLLSLEWAGPIGVIAICLICFAFTFIFGGLGGHLWYYQKDTNPVWFAAFICAVGGLAAGFFFGHRFFYQQAP